MSGLSARIRVPRAHFDVDVALEVAPGETVALMGPSGAGKSTVLAALSGFASLGAGEIRVGGRVVEQVPQTRRFVREAGSPVADARASTARLQAAAGGRERRRRTVRVAPKSRGIVLLGQDARLFPHLDVRENVAFGPRCRGVRPGRARETADAWLARVGLEGAGDRRPGDLSGGEQQRVAVARALAASPQVVLLDEPLVALDPVTAGDIRSMLRAQLADVTTVAVTHDAADAVALADRLLVLEAGRVTQAGPVRDVLAAPATAFAAAIAGLNRVAGATTAGEWEREGVRLRATDAVSRALAAERGRHVAALFRPASVRLDPPGDAPNTWAAVVDRVEPTPRGIRVHAGWCVAELDAASAGHLRPGDRVRLGVDPGEVRLVNITSG